jgi:hypothetical protein
MVAKRPADATNWKWSKAIGAVAALVVTALFAPWVLARVAQVSSDRQKETEVRVSLVSSIDQAITGTVVEANLFAHHLILPLDAPSPTGAASSSLGATIPTSAVVASDTTYGDDLNAWLDQSSQLGDEITVYFGNTACSPDPPPLASMPSRTARVRCDWLYLFSGVTDYLRLCAHVEQINRPEAAARIRASLANLLGSPGSPALTAALGGTGRRFTAAADQTRDLLLLARDRYIQDLEASRAQGFLQHFWNP